MIAVPPCPMCGGRCSVAWASGCDRWTSMPGSFTFVQCGRCGLLGLHPRPGDLAPFYPDDYEFFVAYERRLYSPLRILARRYGLQKRARIVARASGCKVGSLLDVGCASGAFLATMRDRGWHVQGIEPGAAAEIARRRGLSIHQGTLETAGLTSSQFDAVTMWDVLEHVPDPLATLRTAADVLKPGGVAIIRVPNPLGLDARLFGRYWTGLDMPRHLWLFTWSKLKAFLERAGFMHIRRLEGYGPYHMWRYSAEFWLEDRRPRLARPLKALLRSPLAQLFTWPFFRAIERSELNSLLLAAAYK